MNLLQKPFWCLISRYTIKNNYLPEWTMFIHWINGMVWMVMNVVVVAVAVAVAVAVIFESIQINGFIVIMFL